MHPRGGSALLDLEPALGRHLSATDREQARRQLVLPAFALPTGPLDLDVLRGQAGVRGRVLAMFVASGVLSADMRLDARVCSQLILGGDVVAFDGTDGDALPARSSWDVAHPATVVLLDERFLSACQRWPRLVTGLLERLALQARRSHRAQAISQLPRVEDRVLGLIWSVADQGGRVHPDGVHVDLPLTHAAIGRMVGAQRPTVSLGLQKLADLGLLRSEEGVWVVDPQTLEHFTHGMDAAAAPRGRPHGARRAAGPPSASAMDVLVGSAGEAEPAGLETFQTRFVRDEAGAVEALGAAAPYVLVLEVDDRSPQRFGEQAVAHLRRDLGLAHVRFVLLQRPGGTPSAPVLAAAHDYVVGLQDERELGDRVGAQLAIAAAIREQAADTTD